MSAEAHTLLISTNSLDGKNENPGDYEIQFFMNETDETYCERFYRKQN